MLKNNLNSLMYDLTINIEEVTKTTTKCNINSIKTTAEAVDLYRELNFNIKKIELVCEVASNLKVKKDEISMKILINRGNELIKFFEEFKELLAKEFTAIRLENLNPTLTQQSVLRTFAESNKKHLSKAAVENIIEVQ